MRRSVRARARVVARGAVAGAIATFVATSAGLPVALAAEDDPRPPLRLAPRAPLLATDPIEPRFGLRGGPPAEPVRGRDAPELALRPARPLGAFTRARPGLEPSPAIEPNHLLGLAAVGFAHQALPAWAAAPGLDGDVGSGGLGLGGSAGAPRASASPSSPRGGLALPRELKALVTGALSPAPLRERRLSFVPLMIGPAGVVIGVRGRL